MIFTKAIIIFHFLAIIFHFVAYIFAANVATSEQIVIDGVTFAARPGALYVPIREAAAALAWPIHWDSKSHRIYLNDKVVARAHRTRLLDGMLIVSVRALEEIGAHVEWDSKDETAVITDGDHEFRIRKGAKRVQIDRTHQRLLAWQGERWVFKSRISTGRMGRRTPLGQFRAIYKTRMHRSRLYDNAPMPYSVQVVGNIFIHGFRSVPRRPSSHGCIRLPLSRPNPAKWFYEWIDIGTPIEIICHRKA